jgi:hypothetical protein
VRSDCSRGAKKHFANAGTLSFASGSVTPAQLEASLQTLIDLRQGVDAAKAASNARINDEAIQAPPLLRLLTEFQAFVRVTFAHSPDVLAATSVFDLNGPCAEVIIAATAWAAKMERLAMAERVSAARERVEAEGGAWGRPSKVTAADRATALRMRSGGATVRGIAQALGLKRSVVGRLVKSAAASV